MAFAALTRRHLLAAGCAAGILPRSARAAFPDKPVRWIVGYPPGGSTDAIARLLGQSFSIRIGQPVVVDNRPGAGSAVGAAALAAAAGDGYTMMGADNGTLIINPIAYRNLQYDPERDFRPVGLYAGINILLAVKGNSPIRTASEYLEKARAAREPIPYASPGIGSPLHLAMERLALEARVSLSHVAYRGMAPALNDVLSGAVPSLVIDYGTAAEMAKAGQLRVLATFSAQRLPGMPDVPTLAEQGLPGFSASAWQGLIVPRRTPDAIVERLADAWSFALGEPQVRARYAELGLDRLPSDPQSFMARWKGDQAHLAAADPRPRHPARRIRAGAGSPAPGRSGPTRSKTGDLLPFW
ncbi:tripartite tricarboxylate transporter substrate binding protein [Roseomonas sp. GC11]|uniref:Bug family tripartite tricarboxylate transporter substrate binding protein n=1 Tax=Roseomonas sp. GC11 TaxID=2950546 RepID=UPI00210C8C6D|nr:tripartite tricarboxylate transporter substrate binding protein [Roseomonas sp. GC11]MCQ4159911.1 tripartite tricarboxylate transporter substrate binding protein [Roseomonas sp. GC11]